MTVTKDDQLLQAASTGNNHQPTTLLTTHTPSPALIQQMLIKAIYPNAHLPILTTLFTHFPQAPISEEPIRSSCYQGSLPISSALVAQDPHTYTGSFDDEKETPMVLAVQSRQSYEFLSFLLANEADPYLHHGRFALIFPAAVIMYRGALDAVAALGDWGVDLRGRNSLLGAVGRGYGRLARYLLGSGVRPENDITEDNESTALALHLAARGGDVDMVRLLLEYGAADIKDDKGTTAVQVAEEKQYLHIAQLLRAYNNVGYP